MRSNDPYAKNLIERKFFNYLSNSDQIMIELRDTRTGEEPYQVAVIFTENGYNSGYDYDEFYLFKLKQTAQRCFNAQYKRFKEDVSFIENRRLNSKAKN